MRHLDLLSGIEPPPRRYLVNPDPAPSPAAVEALVEYEERMTEGVQAILYEKGALSDAEIDMILDRATERGLKKRPDGTRRRRIAKPLYQSKVYTRKQDKMLKAEILRLSDLAALPYGQSSNLERFPPEEIDQEVDDDRHIGRIHQLMLEAAHNATENQFEDVLVALQQTSFDPKCE